jgi:hypothetical protein
MEKGMNTITAYDDTIFAGTPTREAGVFVSYGQAGYVVGSFYEVTIPHRIPWMSAIDADTAAHDWSGTKRTIK